MKWLTYFSFMNLILGCFLFEKLKKSNGSCFLLKVARISSTSSQGSGGGSRFNIL